MSSVSFGGEKYERLEIAVRGYEREPVGEYYDDNWLNVRITVAAGAFRGACDAAFQVAELAGFRDELATLFQTLTGRARLRTMEKQLTLDCEGNGRGLVEMRGVALDQAGIGNRLTFTLQLDQSQIRAALGQLDAILAEFPVRNPGEER